MKLDLKKILWATGLAMLCYAATLSSLINRLLPGIVRYAIPAVIIVAFLLANSLKLKRYVPDYYIPWALFFLFVIVGVVMHRMDYLLSSTTIFLCVVLGILLMPSHRWLGIAEKILALFTGIYVFFTFFFFMFPESYPIMIELYGYIPIGTVNGQMGYRAGLADHYSSNGIFIAVFLLLMAVSWMASTDRTKRERRDKYLRLLMSILAMVALLMTTKRGVLLWSMLSLLSTYWIVSRRKLKSFLKLLGSCFLLLVVLTFLIERIPQLNTVFLRFFTIGTDGSSLERLAMWKMAFSMFEENPFFGTGFWTFQERYADSLFGIYHNDLRYKYMFAHNVYFQVLAETGLIGLFLYLMAVGMLLRETIRLVRIYSQDENTKIRFFVQFSLCLQIFYLLYSISGNCLYDIVFYFYGLAMAMATTIHYYDRCKVRNTVLSHKGRKLDSAGVRRI